MIKVELIGKIYKDLDCKYTKKEIEEIYSSLIDVICKELEEESKSVSNRKSVEVNIPGLGKLKISQYPGSIIYRNKVTKAKSKFPCNNRVYFKPNSRIKKSINNK